MEHPALLIGIDWVEGLACVVELSGGLLPCRVVPPPPSATDLRSGQCRLLPYLTCALAPLLHVSSSVSVALTLSPSPSGGDYCRRVRAVSVGWHCDVLRCKSRLWPVRCHFPIRVLTAGARFFHFFRSFFSPVAAVCPTATGLVA